MIEVKVDSSTVPVVLSDVKPGADILDACCGGRMFWYDAQRDDVIYMDRREGTTTLCDGRTFEVRPDVIGDFRHMPFPDGRFQMVVFDPPHRKCGHGYMAEKYGLLADGWEEDITVGFRECMRVLADGGILIFKWSECQIPLKKVTPLFPCQPMFGQRHSSNGSIWTVFRKEGSQ